MRQTDTVIPASHDGFAHYRLRPKLVNITGYVCLYGNSENSDVNLLVINKQILAH